jgi:prephenate dehydratase
MVKIGVQGGKGSFSESAGKTFARNHGIENFEIIYQISSEMVLGGVESGSTEFGVFAMENAQGGVVIESVEALALHRCKIVEMFHIPISQNLLALHEIFVGDLTEIHSHQQALRQCRNYLSEYFWTRPLIEAVDTAEAARRLSEGKLPKTAGVISNKNCAGIYDLKIIEEDIHDLKNNLTFFLGIEAL